MVEQADPLAQDLHRPAAAGGVVGGEGGVPFHDGVALGGED